MINLLDDVTKRNIRAARLNVVLLTYCAIVGLALVCVVLLILFSNWWLANKTSAANAEKSANNAKTAPYASVRAEAAAYNASLTKVQSIITNRSHFNVALTNIAASLPAGASVDTLTLVPNFTATPFKVSYKTNSVAAATALKDKLSKLPIYSKVALDPFTCSAASTCIATLNVTPSEKIFTEAAE